MEKIICLIAAIIIAAAAMPAAAAESGLFQTGVFASGDGGYNTYRIPAMIVTLKGTVLAFAEARKNSSADNGNIDMVLRRSEDNGTTWGETITIWDDPGDVTIGNPAPVQDRDTGIIHLLLCRENRQVFVLQSSDDGLTWSAPREITADVMKPDWKWVATGPGHGVQLDTGRIVIPSDHTTGKWQIEGGAICSHIIYSDDHGKTWKTGAALPKYTDESIAAQLADGSLYLNMRNNYFKKKRAYAISKDGGETFGKLKWDNYLIEPVCQGSVIRYTLESAHGRNRLLFSNPASLTRDRMTVKMSYDEARTWPVSRLINEGPSGYSDLAILPDMTIGLLYENGEKKYHEKITFARFSLEWLTDGKDSIK